MKLCPRGHSVITIAGHRGQGDGGSVIVSEDGEQQKDGVGGRRVRAEEFVINKGGLGLPCGKTSIVGRVDHPLRSRTGGTVWRCRFDKSRDFLTKEIHRKNEGRGCMNQREGRLLVI